MNIQSNGDKKAHPVIAPPAGNGVNYIIALSRWLGKYYRLLSFRQELINNEDIKSGIYRGTQKRR